MSHLRTTILVSLVLLISFSLGNYKVLESVPEKEVEGYAILIEKTYKILKDISLLCLGSNGNLKFSFDAGYVIGYILKSKGISAYVFATLDTLDETDEDPLNRISSSPYISAKVIEYFANGLAAAGVLPVLDGRYINSDLVRVLVLKGLFLPVFVEDESHMDKLRTLGYESIVFTRKRGRAIVLRWRGKRKINAENLRREILKRSIVLLNPRGNGIAVNEPFATAKVLVFSDEKWLLDLAKKVESGLEPSTGRKTW